MRAAQDTGAAGQTAVTSLFSLLSKSNPAALVGLRWGIGVDGSLQVVAINKTPRTLAGINLQVRIIDAQGNPRSHRQPLARLRPSHIVQTSTVLRPGSGQVQLSVVSIESVLDS